MENEYILEFDNLVFSLGEEILVDEEKPKVN